MSINSHYRKAPHRGAALEKYLAEAAGVFVLTLVVILLSLSRFAGATPFVASLVVVILVHAIGHISGTHINPAITVGLFIQKKITGNNAVAYVLAQFAGASLAAYLGVRLLGYHPMVPISTWSVSAAEAAGAFILGYGVASVVYGHIQERWTGLVIGAYLLAAILISSQVSAGALNPAVAFGLGLFSWPYFIGPVLGAVLGIWSYRQIFAK